MTNQISEVDKQAVAALRFLAVDAVERAASGHPGAPMEAAGLGYILWTRFLRHNPSDPGWPNRDRFVLSCGHASMLLYGLLHLTGYDLSLDDLKNFRQWESRTPGHPELNHTPGVETTTGPLGQGFGNAVGLAMAERHLAARFNRPGFALVDHRVWAFASDGDLMEGVGAEAASLAGHLKLENLAVVYLDNRITIEGSTDLAFSEDVAGRFEAYGWRVLRIPDPEDLPAVAGILLDARTPKGRPTLIIARTHIGFGAPNKQDTAEAHGSPLGAQEARLARERLGWPAEPAFHVPEAVREAMKSVGARGRGAQAEWIALLERYRAAHPDLARAWEELARPRPDAWAARRPAFPAGESLATRQASGKTLNAMAPAVPGLLGGSADLAPSNNTRLEALGDFSARSPEGRNIHFGVREHAMGAVMNGLALSGRLIPYGGTFLTFADYMRPAIRLAALMKLGVVYVFTHDSIGVGEDGPTHQPVEQLASLRAIPGLVVLRPADANETAVAWSLALERRNGPTALVLTRQKVPTLDRQRWAPAEEVRRGGYRMARTPDPQVLLIATGSEVALALAAHERLTGLGVLSDVVNLASWELFEGQEAEYRESVLPSRTRARVVVEAGVSMGWHRYAGPEGEFVTLDRFGASAPGEDLMARFGFTADRVVEAAQRATARESSKAREARA